MIWLTYLNIKIFKNRNIPTDDNIFITKNELFIAYYRKCEVKWSRSVMSSSFRHYGLWPTRLLSLWNFPGKGNWSGLPFPSPGDLPHPGIEPGSPALWADTLPSEPPGKSTIGNRLSYNMNEYLKFQIKSLSMELTQHSMFEHCKV